VLPAQSEAQTSRKAVSLTVTGNKKEDRPPLGKRKPGVVRVRITSLDPLKKKGGGGARRRKREKGFLAGGRSTRRKGRKLDNLSSRDTSYPPG